jgi:hypothetical protein
MEPTTTTLLTALVAGAAAATAEAVGQAIKDAYNGLKQLVIQKFSAKADVEKAIRGVESKPDSPGRQMTLKEELESAVEADPTAAQDQALLDQAQKLLTLLQQAGHLAAASVKITQTGSGGIAIGTGAKAAGEQSVVTDTIQGPVVVGDHVHQVQTKSYIERQTNTEGGTAIEGNVYTGGGDFVGRDKIVGGKRQGA